MVTLDDLQAERLTANVTTDRQGLLRRMLRSLKHSKSFCPKAQLRSRAGLWQP